MKAGWYTFADGHKMWAHGFSRLELKREVIKHGKLIDYQPTR